MDKWFEEIKNTVIAGKHKEIEALVEKAIQHKVGLDDLINNALIASGAPLDTEFAENIGADAYRKDAAEAVNIVRSFTGL